MLKINLVRADDWLANNLDQLGGRAVLVILKDRKIVYVNSENNLSRRQKIIGKFIARGQGKCSF
ncbi:MAG: hypothetical protein ABI261_02155 [Ginsengibacter sp.]